MLLLLPVEKYYENLTNWLNTDKNKRNIYPVLGKVFSKQ
jgi:hypothetical protein